MSCSQVLCILWLSVCSAQVAAMVPLKLQWLLDRLSVSFDSSLWIWVAEVFGWPWLELWIEQEARRLLQGRSLLFLVPHTDSQYWALPIHFVCLLCQQNKNNSQVVWTTLCRLTFPELLVCNSFPTDLRNVLLRAEMLWFRLVYVYKYLIIHTHIYVYMHRCTCTCEACPSAALMWSTDVT